MPRWTWGYNTNGFAHHRLREAIEVISGIGFEAIALTPDVGHLDFQGREYRRESDETQSLLDQRGLGVVVETGARFVLDPIRKHYPSLLCRENGECRIEYLKKCVDLAAELGAGVCSLWAGHNFEGLADEDAHALLLSGLEAIVDYGESRDVMIALEPEPGMFIETLDQFLEVARALDGRGFGLALDVGHLMVTGELPMSEQIRRVGDHIVTVAVEDMMPGVHEHLPFGHGAIDFGEVFAALADVDYGGIVSVELSRASTDAVREATAAWDFLSQFK